MAVYDAIKEVITLLEDRKKELEGQFKALEDEKTKLVDQGRTVQQRLNEINAEQLRLQGSYAEVERLLKESVKE